MSNHSYYITKLKKSRTTIFALLCAALFAAAFTVTLRAGADTETTVWIMCQPGDWVHVRRRASTKSESLGRLEAGDPVVFTGGTKDGFIRAKVSLEENEGWIYAGYVSAEKPVNMGGADYVVRADGRVACRKCIDGARRCWVVDGSRVSVYWMTGEWAVTNKGFIRSEYLKEWK